MTSLDPSPIRTGRLKTRCRVSLGSGRSAGVRRRNQQQLSDSPPSVGGLSANSRLILQLLAAVLHGARQAGKTYLAQQVVSGPHPAEYFTLDDPAVLTAATSDPTGFIQALRGSAVIDEVQRAPQLLVAI